MRRLSLQQKRQHNLNAISQSMPTANPADYVIERRNYSRNNSDERLYRTKWWPTLMRIYDCRCGLCQEDRDGLELDHFWIPKSHGGNLILVHASTRRLVNNAVPLCTACNRQKHESIIELNAPQLVRIAAANREMTAKLNDAPSVEGKAVLYRYEPGDERRALGVDNSVICEVAKIYKSNPTPEILSILKADINEYLFAPEDVKL